MDLRYALRSLRKDPGFTALAVLILALGIGANTAVFTVVNTVLLKPLAYRDADRIVNLGSLWKKSGRTGQVSAPDYHDWHDQSTSFSSMAHYANFETSVASATGGEFAMVAEVTPEFFKVFDAQPAAGRFFTGKDTNPGTLAVVSFEFAAGRFGSAPAALGGQVRMFAKSFTVVGVAPPRFDFPQATRIWFPANGVFKETPSRSAHNYRVVARLKPGVTVQQAQAQMSAIGTRLEQQYPASNTGKNVGVARLLDRMVVNVRFTLYLVLGAVSLVLLIACGNMANLLLAKATARSREIAIRAAVGAGRLRIVRQLVIESLVLSLVSAAAGLLLALGGVRALVAIAPPGIPRLAEVSIDGRVLAFTIAISVLATLLFGLVPAFQATRVDLIAALKQSGRSNVAGAHRLRGALVVAEIAVSVVLLAGAGLLIRSFAALQNVALGFQPENVLIMETSVPSSGEFEAPETRRFFEDVLSQASALPGVRAAALTMEPPGESASDGSYWIDRIPTKAEFGVNAPQAIFSVVSPGFFATLEIPVKAGREFSAADGPDAPFVAIVNESLARKSFPGRSPLGHTILCGFDSDKPMTIVGVVADSHTLGPAAPPQPELYMPYPQHAHAHESVLVRTAVDPHTLAGPLRRIVREHSTDASVKFSTMQLRMHDNVAAPRFRMLLLGLFAALALCLAMAGVYGVTAYAVGQRSGEIGMRMALGATAGDVLRLVLLQALRLAAIGLAIGLAGAVAATRLLSSMLFEVKSADPATYAAVAAALVFIALLAGFVPARRAASIDPLAALRQE